jgi:hypothetical protein
VNEGHSDISEVNTYIRKADIYSHGTMSKIALFGGLIAERAPVKIYNNPGMTRGQAPVPFKLEIISTWGYLCM